MSVVAGFTFFFFAVSDFDFEFLEFAIVWILPVKLLYS